MRFIHADVSVEESVKALVDFTVVEYGRLDGVHCNAGVWGKGKVTEFDDAIWEKIMNVNVKSVFWTAKHAIPAMEASGKARLPRPTSVAAFIGFPATRSTAPRRGRSSP